MNNGQEPIRTTVYLYGLDAAILQQIQKEKGISRSDAVRLTIRQYGGVEETNEEARVQQPC